MVIDFEKNKCCGCMACKNICPKGAIYTEKDEFGFLYPKVDKSKCINCGLCKKCCDYNKKDRTENLTKKAFSLVISNKKELYNSTSGGAFTVLSDIILEQNGVVFGAIMDDKFNIRHIKASNVEERNKMRGSKYVQSETGFIFKEVLSELKNGKKVMFVGSPCQVGGLNSFLMKKYDNLITVEFLCHGVPNNDFFKSHINFLEKKYKKIATNYSHRSKKFLWYAPGIEEVSFKRKTKDGYYVQSYLNFFYDNLSLRPSCYDCTYHKYERSADITIGDFSRYKNISGKLDVKGTSLMLVNTEKGLKFIDDIDSNIAILKEVSYEKIKNNKNININETKCLKDREEFWQDYLNNGYEYLVKKYINNSFKVKLEFTIKKNLRKLASIFFCK